MNYIHKILIHHIEHLKDLGLYDDEKPGDEFISRL